MDVYNERSGVEVQAHFTDAQNLPTVPATAHWRLDCETTGKVLRDWTSVSTVTVQDESGLIDVYAEVEIPASLNAIQSNNNARELKTLIVSAAKDQSGEYNETYQYYVKNLRGRS